MSNPVTNVANVPSKTSSGYVSIGISVLALVISFIAAAVSVLTYQRDPKRDSEKLTMDVIRQTYSDFFAINAQRAQNPLHSHLFEVSDSYSGAVKQVKLAIANDLSSSSRLARLRLEERAIADSLFTLFEQAYYQWKLATVSNDAARTSFLKEELDYFTERLLRNPRLLWFWANDGGKLSLQYEKATQVFYESSVQPKSQARDDIGPFGSDPLSTALNAKPKHGVRVVP